MPEVDFPCYPACESCRVAGMCATPAVPPDIPTVPARVKGASDYMPILLKCGHEIEGHGFTHMLSDLGLILCHYHGWQKRVEPKKETKAAKKKRLRQEQEDAGQESMVPF